MAAIALLTACASPTNDPSVLKEIEAEAKILMMSPTDTHGVVPRDRWPRAIASLKPENVTVFQQGLEILVKPGFDGGWGYFVPKDERIRTEPEGRYTDVGHGVYWYRPY